MTAIPRSGCWEARVDAAADATISGGAARFAEFEQAVMAPFWDQRDEFHQWFSGVAVRLRSRRRRAAGRGPARRRGARRRGGASRSATAASIDYTEFVRQAEDRRRGES